MPLRDVRRRRPPLLSFLLRMETARRLGRVASLLAIDFAGVAGALFTALALKSAVNSDFDAAKTWTQTRQWLAFAYLVVVLMFARADLYADRPRRPGWPQIATALFQATIISLVFALADGQHFSSYYVFYGSLFFSTVYISVLRGLHLRVTGWLLEQAGYERALERATARRPRIDPRTARDRERLCLRLRLHGHGVCTSCLGRHYIDRSLPGDLESDRVRESLTETAFASTRPQVHLVVVRTGHAAQSADRAGYVTRSTVCCDPDQHAVAELRGDVQRRLHLEGSGRDRRPCNR